MTASFGLAAAQVHASVQHRLTAVLPKGTRGHLVQQRPLNNITKRMIRVLHTGLRNVLTCTSSS